MNPAILSISISNCNRETKCDQLTKNLRNLISENRIAPGEKLPSSRSLGEEVFVSRTTARAALDNLVSEGYAETRSGSGTYVVANPPDYTVIQTSIASPVLKHQETGQKLNAFAVGMPETKLFPHRQWAKLFSQTWAEPSHELLEFRDPFGWRSLRHAICQHLSMWRGIKCSSEQVVITSGMANAMDVLLRVVFSPGQKILVEDPCNARILHEMRSRGLNCQPIDLSDGGVNTISALNNHKDAAGIFLTPSSRYPLGMALPDEQRNQLIQWAEETNSIILEDDFDAEFCYDGHQKPALASLDRSGSVIYIGSFSRVISPNLRLGFILLPERLVQSARRELETRWRPASTIMQPVLSKFMNQGQFGTHLRKMRKLYSKRQNVLISAIENFAKDALCAKPSAVGMHIIVKLLHDRTDIEATRLAAKDGIEVRPLASYYFNRASTNKIVMGFSSFEQNVIEQGVQDLARALRN